MKIQISRNHLMMMNAEVNQMMNSGSIKAIWDRPKINEFLNQNGVRIRSIQDKLFEIFNRCHELDREGNPVMVDEVLSEEDVNAGKNAQKTPKLKEFVTEEGHQKERSEYLNEIIEINV